MGLKDDIISKAKEIESTTFVVTPVTYVPTIDTSALTFGCTGLEFNATVLYIDMRGSTKVLNSHQKRVVAKLHMIYYHAVVKIAKANGGEIRSFNGDSLLVFFQGTTKKELSIAVKTAMQIRYAITFLVNDKLKSYMDIDFGIGLDNGKILATKVGLGGTDTTKDLIWIGNAVNKSTVISDNCKSPNYVGISKYVYDNLEDYVKYGKQKDIWGNEVTVNMWSSSTFEYNGKYETYYRTSWYFYVY
jgi:class 3 adenylate cyclase